MSYGSFEQEFAKAKQMCALLSNGQPAQNPSVCTTVTNPRWDEKETVPDHPWRASCEGLHADGDTPEQALNLLAYAALHKLIERKKYAETALVEVNAKLELAKVIRGVV